MKAIPTLYRGIQMRSRLEAKWASVFDQLGWKWEYEPIDLDGWIPDFLIQTQAPNQPLLVEVKPVLEEPTALCEKLVKHAEGFEILIVGAATSYLCHGSPVHRLGWITEWWGGDGDEGKQGWDDASLMQDGANFGLCPTQGAWRDRIGSCYYKSLIWDHDFLDDIWARACNSSQWKAPR